MRKLTQQDFLDRAKAVHGDRYDYSHSTYVKYRTKVEIVCKEHGAFWQEPTNHLMGQGCATCGSIQSSAAQAIQRTSSTAAWVSKARAVHGDKYSYDKVEYVRSSGKVIIGCRSCGRDFPQNANSHITIACGCPYCMKCGYRIGKPGSLYVMSCGGVVKVGITNRDVNLRTRDITRSSGKDFTLEFFIKFEDGTVPPEVEKVLLKELRQQYETPGEEHNGYTECFIGVDKEALLRRVTQLCGEALSAKQLN